MGRIANATATVAIILLASGCRGSNAGVRSAAAASAVAASPGMLTAAAYVAAASSIDLYEVRSAELALQRTQDPAIRAFAERSLSAHQGTSAQLSMAGRRLNLLPSAALEPEHQAMLDALAATGDFDNTYRAQQQIIVQQGVQLHSRFAQSGASATLRPVAQNAESVMRANLRALRNSR